MWMHCHFGKVIHKFVSIWDKETKKAVQNGKNRNTQKLLSAFDVKDDKSG